MGKDPSVVWTGTMRALSDDSSSGAVSETAALTRDYLAFERHRTTRRQYVKAFGGMAILVLLGAVFNRVPRDEASPAKDASLPQFGFTD